MLFSGKFIRSNIEGDATMLHIVLIVIHALMELICLAIGTWLVYQIPHREDQRFQVYLGALVLMFIFLIVAILTDWMRITTTMRVIFSGLALLALYMVFRGFQARQTLRQQGADWQLHFIDDMGFTLISLFDGFAIVSVFDLHSPPWLIALIAVAGVVVGVTLLHSVKRRLA